MKGLGPQTSRHATHRRIAKTVVSPTPARRRRPPDDRLRKCRTGGRGVPPPPLPSLRAPIDWEVRMTIRTDTPAGTVEHVSELLGQGRWTRGWSSMSKARRSCPSRAACGASRVVVGAASSGHAVATDPEPKGSSTVSTSSWAASWACARPAAPPPPGVRMCIEFLAEVEAPEHLYTQDSTGQDCRTSCTLDRGSDRFARYAAREPGMRGPARLGRARTRARRQTTAARC
jgi:hypothetical protein